MRSVLDFTGVEYSGNAPDTDEESRQLDEEEPRTLQGDLLKEARKVRRGRWLQANASIASIILSVVMFGLAVDWLNSILGQVISNSSISILVARVLALIPFLGWLVWSLVRLYQIDRKWNETKGDLNATTRLDCAMAYVRSLRLYVNLKTVSERTNAVGMGLAILGLLHVSGQLGNDDLSSAAFGCAVVIMSALVLWLSFYVGHGAFHPGAAIAKSVLWLHIQAHEKDTSATERNQILIEDQMRIRQEHPVWYINYEITGNRRA